MIIVVGTALARPEHAPAVLSLSLAHCRRSRAEEGCIDHTVAVDQETPNLFRFVEYWRDVEALKMHFAVPASREFIGTMTPMLAEPAAMKVYQADEANLG